MRARSCSEPPPSAIAAHARGSAALDHQAAIPHFEEAARLAPAWSVPWASLASSYKHARRWADCLDAAIRATVLDPDDEGAHWTAGIAATALRRWSVARAAWRACGVRSMTFGDEPVAVGGGCIPIRVDPHGEAETVWVERLDPARGVIVSVPSRRSGRRFRDVILHDGAPHGTRVRDGREYPVFDELELFERSPYETTELDLFAPTEADRDALFEAVAGVDGAIEDWTESRWVCRACSDGGGAHQSDPPPGWISTRRIAIAAKTSDELRARIVAWAAASGRRVIAIR